MHTNTEDQGEAQTNALGLPDPEQQEMTELAELFDKELALAVTHGKTDLPTWYLGKLAQFQALREELKSQYETLCGAIARQERALGWRFGAKFKLAVEADLKRQNTGLKKPKKSVEYLTGKAGFRTGQPSLVIVDEPALKQWCIDHCEEALELKIQRTTPLKEYIKKTGEVPPGADWKDAEDKFYPALDAVTIANSSETPGLPGSAATPALVGAGAGEGGAA